MYTPPEKVDPQGDVNSTGMDMNIFAVVSISRETDLGSLFSGSNCKAERENRFLPRIVELKNLTEENMHSLNPR